MTCTPVNLDGLNAILCTRGSRVKVPTCCKCRRLSEKACDWKIGNGKTCDASICAGCTTSPAPNKDLCPVHAIAWEAWKVQHAKACGPFEQGTLGVR